MIKRINLHGEDLYYLNDLIEEHHLSSTYAIKSNIIDKVIHFGDKDYVNKENYIYIDQLATYETNCYSVTEAIVRTGLTDYTLSSHEALFNMLFTAIEYDGIVFYPREEVDALAAKLHSSLFPVSDVCSLACGEPVVYINELYHYAHRQKTELLGRRNPAMSMARMLFPAESLVSIHGNIAVRCSGPIDILLESCSKVSLANILDNLLSPFNPSMINTIALMRRFYNNKMNASNSPRIYDVAIQYASYLPNPDSFLFNVAIFQNCARALFLDRTGYIGSQQMYVLFRDFLDVIVVKQYGYTIVEKGNSEELGDNEIEYFQFGDSRHIAFLNLLLSGFSPYTIAQIGGHTTIRQQMHYYDHLETYLASKTYTMATEARMSLKVSAGAFDIREKYAISKAVTDANNNELQLMRKIEFGWCASKNFPYECEFDDCLNCPHSIIDEEHQQIIPEKLKQYKNDIHKHVDFLKRVLSNPSLGSDSDRMTAINVINSDVATMATLQNKRHMEV